MSAAIDGNGGVPVARLRALAALGDERASELLPHRRRTRRSYPMVPLQADALSRAELFDFVSWCIRRHLHIWNSSQHGEAFHGWVLCAIKAGGERIAGRMSVAEVRGLALSADTAGSLAAANLHREMAINKGAQAVADAAHRLAFGTSCSRWADFRSWLMAACERAAAARGRGLATIEEELEIQRQELVRRLWKAGR